MVHALKEIRRVLISGTYLIDLRPFIEKPTVDIIVGDEVLSAGFIDASRQDPDDLAANDAVEHMVAAGLFTREQSDSFKLYVYWNTAAEFKTFWDEHSTAILPPKTLARVEQVVSQFGPDSRIRTRINMIIARYRKPHPP